MGKNCQEGFNFISVPKLFDVTTGNFILFCLDPNLISVIGLFTLKKNVFESLIMDQICLTQRITVFETLGAIFGH